MHLRGANGRRFAPIALFNLRRRSLEPETLHRDKGVVVISFSAPPPLEPTYVRPHLIALSHNKDYGFRDVLIGSQIASHLRSGLRSVRRRRPWKAKVIVTKIRRVITSATVRFFHLL